MKIPNGELQGRTALVTGAASGFGEATAKLLAARGARIVGVDCNAELLGAVMAALPVGAAGVHVALSRDLREVGIIKTLADEATAAAGPIDILVNSAGVCRFHRPNEIDAAEWDEIFEIDVRSLFFLSVAIAEKMDPARGGRIIHLGSSAGRRGRVHSAHYAAAKAAVASLGESLALAYGGRRVTVNTVCPAPVLTPLWRENMQKLGAATGRTPEQLMNYWLEQTPLQRLGTVDDIAELIGFLVSDRAAFITGQTIYVCGGFTLTT